jgi:hypothetical protein
MIQATAVWLSSFLLVLADPPPRSGPTPEQIRTAVEQLASDRLQTRLNASRFLWEAGPVAEPALREALKSTDLEVVNRARRILQDFKYGILPDTPDDVVALIRQVVYGDAQSRQKAWTELRDRGSIDPLIRISEAAAEENWHAEIEGLVREDATVLVPVLLLRSEFDRAERWLEQAALADHRYGEPAICNYAAYLLLRGTLDERIARARQEAAAADDQQTARILAYLLRAKGSYLEAREVAKKANSETLLPDLHYRLEDWNQLAQPGVTPGDRGLENLGFTAAFHRLAGNTAEVNRAVDGLIELVDTEPRSARMFAEALMINERWQQAVEMLQKHQPVSAFDLLCARRQYRAAFELIGFGDVRQGYAERFAQLAAEIDAGSKEMSDLYYPTLQLAKVLHQLGERDEAAGLLAALLPVASDEHGSRLGALYHVEFELGLKDQAWEHAAMALAQSQQAMPFYTLLPNHSGTAKLWWQYFCEQYPDEPWADTASRVRHLLEPNRAPRWEPEALAGLISQAESATAVLDAKDRAPWLGALAETCLLHHQGQLAKKYLQKQLDVDRSALPALRLGDLAAEDEQWLQAAEWYDKAWQRDQRQFLAIHLKGHALLRLDRQDEGRGLMQAARLMPLADVSARHELADGLEKRGLGNEARAELDFILQIGPYWSWESEDCWALDDACRRIGNAVVGEDDFLAAACWQRMLLALIKTNGSFHQMAPYVQVSFLINKAHARGLLKAGRVEEALAAISRCQTALPGEGQLVVDLLPELEKVGRQQEAAELFSKAFEAGQALCQEFPRFASQHNNLAWMSARSHQRLDAALDHAQTAVRLDPTNPAYLDTLAEVHFQRGDRELAIRHAQRCLQLDPDNCHFRSQLHRFQHDPLSDRN